MIELSDSEAQSLLEIGSIDNRLLRLKSEITKLANSEVVEQAEDAFLKKSEELKSQRSQLEELETESKRTQTDLDLVESRITRDNQRLAESSNPKDITGIQHELEALAKRKSQLEDAELELLEQLDIQRESVTQLEQQRTALFENQKQVQQQLAENKAELDKEQSELIATRASLMAGINSGLAEDYERRLIRGIAVGKLVSGSCSACNISLTASAANAIRTTPSGEAAHCPECQAILVR